MFRISEQVAGAFAAQGLQRLDELILAGWHRRLHDVAVRAGEEGRGRVLAQVHEAARRNGRLTEVQLVMLADVELVKQTPPVARSG